MKQKAKPQAPSTRSLKMPNQEEAVTFISSVPEDHTNIVVVPGVGIVTAGATSPPQMNGKELTPPKMRELTPAEFELRQKHKAQVRASLAGQGYVDNAIDGVVMNTANPYLSLYREFRAGLITLSELEQGIDSSILSDKDLLKSYEFKSLPDKPEVLRKAEDQVRDKTPPTEWDSAFAELRTKLANKNTEVAAYARKVERLTMENLSSKEWLIEMFERHKENNIYAAKLQAAIDTHLNEA